jgi:hypothetical protein
MPEKLRQGWHGIRVHDGRPAELGVGGREHGTGFPSTLAPRNTEGRHAATYGRHGLRGRLMGQGQHLAMVFPVELLAYLVETGVLLAAIVDQQHGIRREPDAVIVHQTAAKLFWIDASPPPPREKPAR